MNGAPAAVYAAPRIEGGGGGPSTGGIPSKKGGGGDVAHKIVIVFETGHDRNGSESSKLAKKRVLGKAWDPVPLRRVVGQGARFGEGRGGLWAHRQKESLGEYTQCRENLGRGG